VATSMKQALLLFLALGRHHGMWHVCFIPWPDTSPHQLSHTIVQSELPCLTVGYTAMMLPS
jgi:hypothetical protein